MSTYLYPKMSAAEPMASAQSRRDQMILLKAFRLGLSSILALYVLSLETTSLVMIAVTLAITGVALLPSYLWCKGRAVGLPIFPLFALTHIWTFALPLLQADEEMAAYSVGQKAYAGLTVIGFLALGTAVWLRFFKRAPKPATGYLAFAGAAGDKLLLRGLAGSVFFYMALMGGWMWIGGDVFVAVRSAVLACVTLGVFVAVCFRVSRYVSGSKYGLILTTAVLVALAAVTGYVAYRFITSVLPSNAGSIGGMISALRALLLGLGGLSVFGLAYRLGARQLSHRHTVQFIVLLALNMLSSAASLMMVGALSTLALAVVAYTIGSRRIPWLVILAVLPVFAFLHVGKGEMRGKYWQEESGIVQPWEYPGWYAEWASYSWERVNRRSLSDEKTDETASLTDRAGLTQLLLLAQRETALGTPLLYGETYSIIPELLIPRFLMPDKAASHEGTYILNIHYGKQTREDTARTTIGWGMLTEAYANFGLLGCAALAIALGCVYGGVARWSAGAPLLSFRFLFTILLVSFAYQTEMSASVYLTSLFQSTAALTLVTLLFMKTQHHQSAAAPPRWSGPAQASA